MMILPPVLFFTLQSKLSRTITQNLQCAYIFLLQAHARSIIYKTNASPFPHSVPMKSTVKCRHYICHHFFLGLASMLLYSSRRISS